jgi:iron complex outermembrane receptor protein
VYGSDAVTGVVNFITRKDYDGIELSTQYGIADHYSTFNFAVVAGTNWAKGNVLVAYNYSGNSELPNSARPDINGARQDIIRGQADPTLFTGLPANTGATTTPPAGPGTTGPYSTAIPYPSLGLNSQNFNCPVATIAAKSNSTTAYLYQPTGGYGGSPVTTSSSTSQANQGVCDFNLYGSDISANLRNNGMVSLRQQFSETLSGDLEVVYGANSTATHGGDRGTLSAVAYGPNATAANTGVTGLTAGNINPFYQSNTTIGQNSEFIRYDFTQLMGEAPVNKGYQQQYFVSGGLAWDLGNDREITLGGVTGNGYVYSRSVAISAANANLALNGTPNTNGIPNQATLAGSGTVDIFGLGTTSETQRVLTTLNALDVWDPPATNKTSKQVLASIADGGANANTSQNLQDIIAKFDGPVYDLPAGKIKLAAGVEYLHRTYTEWGSRDATTGPSRSTATSYNYVNGRQVYSAFLELNVPVVSPEMGIPGMESLTFDVSGRYDHYSDAGETKNPKIGLDWLIIDGLKARASWGSSFVAANVHDNAHINSQSGIGAAGTPGTPSAPGSVIAFNSTLPWSSERGIGAGLAGTWVSTGPSCAAGGGIPVDANGQSVAAGAGSTYAGAVGCKVSFNGNATTSTSSFGIGVSGANDTLKPTTGRSVNVGIDFNAGKFWDALTGLTGSVSWWDLNDRGAITNQQVTNNIPQDVTFAPIGGWTQTSPYIVNFVSGRPINLVLQPTIWVTTDTRLQNAYNVWENGIDFELNYVLPTDSYGTFRASVNGSTVLRFTQEGGNIGPLFDVLDGKNAPRFNTADSRGRLSLGWAMEGFSATLSM